MSRNKSIALIGFRATGKTLLGKMLAQEINRPFIDMDALLAASFGMNIQEWVALFGWTSFREAESKLLRKLTGQSGVVVATGGGVILSESNRRILRDHFIVVWLQASSRSILQRLQNDPNTASQRPALTDFPLKEEIEHLLSLRLPLYEETAHFQLSTDTHPPSVAMSMILAFLQRSDA